MFSAALDIVVVMIGRAVLHQTGQQQSTGSKQFKKDAVKTGRANTLRAQHRPSQNL